MNTLYLIKPQNNLDIVKHTLTTNLLKAKAENSFIHLLTDKNDVVSKYVRENFNSALNNKTLTLHSDVNFKDLFENFNVEYIVELHESEFIGKIGQEVKELTLTSVLVRRNTKACRKQLFITSNYSIPESSDVITSKDTSIPIGG